MATGYIGERETLQQVVITPNRRNQQVGNAVLSQGRSTAAEQEEVRLSPGQVRNKSSRQGALSAAEKGQQPTSQAGQASKGEEGFWGADGFTFGDLLDIVNPLQHIPIVSTVYRAITGDTISNGARLLGGAALGGVAGFAASTLSAMVQSETGKDIGEHMLASVAGSEGGASSAAITSAASNSRYAAAPAHATRLSGGDAVTQMAAPEAITPPPSAEEAMATIALGEADIGRQRQIYTLGGMEAATRQYQHMQAMNRIQQTIVGIDG